MANELALKYGCNPNQKPSRIFMKDGAELPVTVLNGKPGITAVLAKIGMEHINSTLATALRTIVVLGFSWLMVFVVGSQGEISSLSAHTLLFLILSGLSTGNNLGKSRRAYQGRHLQPRDEKNPPPQAFRHPQEGFVE